jgi:hypothetical protein
MLRILRKGSFLAVIALSRRCSRFFVRPNAAPVVIYAYSRLYAEQVRVWRKSLWSAIALRVRSWRYPMESNMLIDRLATLTSLAGLAVATVLLASPANALTMAQCSTKYNAAKDAGTLDGQTWNQFRKAECAADADAATKPDKKSTAKADKTKKAATADEPKGLTAKECSVKYQAAKEAGTLSGMKWNDFRKS